MAEDAIEVLNSLVKVKLAPSKIHGVGVIAIRDIEKGTMMNANMFGQAFNIPFESFDQIRPEIRDLIMERNPHVVNDKPFMYPDTHIQTYMNHSDDPNYDPINDITLKDIEEGEELLEDYRKIKGWEQVFPWLT